MTVQNSGTLGPWVVKKCGCGSPYCHIYYTSNGTFYQGSGYSLADATRIARVPEMEARIEELEAEVARLKAGTDQLGRMWEANQDLLAESKEIDFQFDEMKRLTTENARLRMILAALDAYALGEPSQPPVTGVEKRNIDTGDAP